MTIEDKDLLKVAEDLGIEDAANFDDENELKVEIKKVEEKKEDKDGEDADFWKSEAKKAFTQRDEAKKERRKLQTQMSILKDDVDGAPKSEDLDVLKEELKTFKEMKKTIDEEKEEKELKEASEIEKAEIGFKKQLDALREDFDLKVTDASNILDKKDKELINKDKEVSSLRRLRLKSEILESATDMKAYNPSQIVKILDSEFEYDATLDKFWRYERDNKGKLVDEKTVEERVKEFLSDPLNDNLVEANLKRGTGEKGGSEEKDKILDKKGIFNYNAKDKSLLEEADEKGLSVEDLIDIKKMRDERLALIKERKK